MRPTVNRKLAKSRLKLIVDDYHGNKGDFSKSLGVSQSVLSQAITYNDRPIPRSILEGLAFLGYNLQWVLFGVGAKTNSLNLQTTMPRLEAAEIQALTQPFS